MLPIFKLKPLNFENKVTAHLLQLLGVRGFVWSFNSMIFYHQYGKTSLLTETSIKAHFNSFTGQNIWEQQILSKLINGFVLIIILIMILDTVLSYSNSWPDIFSYMPPPKFSCSRPWWYLFLKLQCSFHKF